MPYRMNLVGVDSARKLRFRAEMERRFALNVRGQSPRTPLVSLLGVCSLPCGHGR